MTTIANNIVYKQIIRSIKPIFIANRLEETRLDIRGEGKEALSGCDEFSWNTQCGYWGQALHGPSLRSSNIRKINGPNYVMFISALTISINDSLHDIHLRQRSEVFGGVCCVTGREWWPSLTLMLCSIRLTTENTWKNIFGFRLWNSDARSANELIELLMSLETTN